MYSGKECGVYEYVPDRTGYRIILTSAKDYIFPDSIYNVHLWSVLYDKVVEYNTFQELKEDLVIELL